MRTKLVRALSFDGKGINDKSREYSPRVATFASETAAEDFGTVFESSTEMLAALYEVQEYLQPLEDFRSTSLERLIRGIIARAEGLAQ